MARPTGVSSGFGAGFGAPVPNADSPRTERLLRRAREMRRYARSVRKALNRARRRAPSGSPEEGAPPPTRGSTARLRKLEKRARELGRKASAVGAQVEVGDTRRATERRLKGIGEELSAVVRSARSAREAGGQQPGIGQLSSSDAPSETKATTTEDARGQGASEAPSQASFGSGGGAALASLTFLGGAGLLLASLSSTASGPGDAVPAQGALIGQK